MRIDIRLDDNDRQSHPDLPWLASLVNGDSTAIIAGVGATAYDAITNLLDQLPVERGT